MDKKTTLDRSTVYVFFEELRLRKEVSELCWLFDIGAMLNMDLKNFFKMQDSVIAWVNKIEVYNMLLGIMTKDIGITKLSRCGGIIDLTSSLLV